MTRRNRFHAFLYTLPDRAKENSNGFLVDEGRERLNIPPKAGHYRPASETSFKWCLAGGRMMVHH